jgi:uncharacterized protein
VVLEIMVEHILLFIATTLISLHLSQSLVVSNRMMFRSLSRRITGIRVFSTLNSNPVSVAADPNTQYMEIATRLWVERIVMGQGLCPWAASTLVGNKLRICTIPGGADGSDESLLNVCDGILRETQLLLDDEENKSEENKGDESSTTLIVLPEFKEFDAFLELIDVVEEIFEKENINDFLQVAHFHPDYVFADSDTKELEIENFTNRSPFPIIHLLKVDEVSDAIDSYNSGDTSTIWKKNKVTLRALGIAKVKAIGAKILIDAALEVEKRKSCLKF